MVRTIELFISQDFVDCLLGDGDDVGHGGGLREREPAGFLDLIVVNLGVLVPYYFAFALHTDKVFFVVEEGGENKLGNFDHADKLDL